jgi:iron complex transport system permease protein
MKITLDLTRLVEDGRLTQAEADRLRTLAAHDTGSLGVNILVGFGVIAVAAGAGALVPNFFTAFALGALMFAAGTALMVQGVQQWSLLAQILTVTGALTLAGASVAMGEGSLASMLIATALLFGASLIARSSLLIGLAVLALGACLGAQAGYWHATYALAIYEPLLTILLFSALAFGAYLYSRSLKSDYERLAITAARTAVLMVNFGFWIGSLWGDRLVLLRSMLARTPSGEGIDAATVPVIPDWVFSIGWAAALLAVGAWAVRANRRWAVNVVAVFGAIHFYTQWFERLGASPLSVLLGGLLMLGFALALWRFNQRARSAEATS